MIAKRIDHQAANDNYRALALYVTAAGHEEEKLLTCWTAGCLEDDILSGIHEVEATQALNKTSLKPKSPGVFRAPAARRGSPRYG